MFATLVIERDPLQWSDLSTMLLVWLRDAGGFAAVLLVAWLLYGLRRTGGGPPGAQLGNRSKTWFNLAILVGGIAYVVGGGMKIVALRQEAESAGVSPYDTPANRLLAFAGGCALFVVLLPFFQDARRLRARRIWALARLSFKEAIRSRVLWGFSGLLLVILFGSWFLESRPEDQVRTYVQVVYYAMTPLLLVTAALLASFSLPADIKNQTIHTIVTKPVERFEIILGRFLGYTLLMTLVLLGMTAVSLLYMFRQFDKEAEESLRARVPVRGDLRFEGTKGDSVGREWEYRRYIAGGRASPHRAVWAFFDPPRGLASRTDNIHCEFTFDIFRTSKGKPEDEGKGVFASLMFRTWQWKPEDLERYHKELEERRGEPNIENELAKKYGYFEVLSKQVYDYHTMAQDVPPGLFQNAFENEDKRPVDPTRPGFKVAPVEVWVKCESPSQYLGMAKYDLYLLDSEGFFWLNFFKGAAGLWMRMVVVIGLAVTLSTYLSGVIAFLTTQFFFIGGFFRDFIRELAEGKSVGGGPAESFVRLITRENMITPLDASPGANLALGTDQAFRVLFHGLINILPDVDRFDWTSHVAEGFNISAEMIVLTLLVLVGYLVPCGLLAYYLMKTREVAA
jgi:hypothetical protein